VGSVIGIGMTQKCLGSGDDALNFAVLKKIVMGWAVTIPLAMLVSVCIFLPLRPLFQ
jgi:phosphate/sulfate permease